MVWTTWLVRISGLVSWPRTWSEALGQDGSGMPPFLMPRRQRGEQKEHEMEAIVLSAAREGVEREERERREEAERKQRESKEGVEGVKKK
jgi:hypothetical protein